ncbi:MAG: hypothetical protein RIR01_1388 [Bacteroidota bacterium]
MAVKTIKINHFTANKLLIKSFKTTTILSRSVPFLYRKKH